MIVVLILSVGITLLAWLRWGPPRHPRSIRHHREHFYE